VELNHPLSTVTPTLDGDVLALLARHDATYTTGQLRRILTTPSEEGVRKVLQRLSSQGIVQSTKVGNAYTYQLNRDHLAAPHIIGLAQLQDELLNRLEKRLKSWQAPPVYAAVFGSAARGSMTADSDLDLLLIRPTKIDIEVWESQVEDLVDDVTRWIGNDARTLVLRETEVRRGDHQDVLRSVAQDGLTVAGTQTWLMTHLGKKR
jgi:predicted nucleotidyltransferase